MKNNKLLNFNLDFLDKKSTSISKVSSEAKEHTGVIDVVVALSIFAMIILFALGILGVLG